MMLNDFSDEGFLIHADFASPPDVKIFERYREQVGAMDVSKGIGAGCARSRIPDPFQIGVYVHHALLMSQSELGFTSSPDPAISQRVPDAIPPMLAAGRQAVPAQHQRPVLLRPTLFTKSLPRYRSPPSAVLGGTVFMVLALNCSPCSRSLTQHRSATSHSPALTEGSDPTTVVSSR
jgi:hypothetical protein